MVKTQLSKELLEERISKLDAEIKQKETERTMLRDELYNYDVANMVKKIIGKYVILPGFYSTEEADDIKSEYRVFKVDKLGSWCGGNCGYFKVSHFVYVDHWGKCVRFLEAEDLKHYKIADVAACKILTDAQAKKEYEKINKFIQKEFDKIRK